MMILKSITLNNYRPYIGPEKIEFAQGDKNITIIEGQNDSGKTSLLNAFTWCFYGKEYYRKKGNEPLYNKTAMNNISVGESLEVSVLIRMKDNNDREVRFKRTQNFIKIQPEFIKSDNSIYHIFRENSDGIEETISITENFMNSHLPEDLREYFLFDGEQLINLLDHKNKNASLKHGVYTLSQLDLLKSLENHAQQRYTSLHKKFNEINPQLGSKKLELKKLNDNKDKDEKKLKENEIIIKNLEKDIKLYDKEIKEYGENPKQIQNDINDLNYQRKKISENIKNTNTELTTFLVKNFNSIMSIPTLDNFLKISEELKENRYIPSPFKKDFLKVLLNDKKCICGTEFTEDSECYKELLQLFENTEEVTNLADDVNILRGRCEKSLYIDSDSFLNELKQYRKKIIDLEKEDELRSTELKAAKMRLERLEIDRINELTKKIKTSNERTKKLTEENGILRNNLNEIYPKKIKELEKEIEQEKDLESKEKELDKKMKFCKNIISTTKNIRKMLSKEIHEQLQNITTEEFKNIHWKEAYKRVLIDEDFEISFEKEDGTILTSTDPSSGTQLVLALSFMIALNSLSGFKLPLIIDTPLGRLDKNVKENIAEYIPQYSKNKQLTMIVTNSEYDEDFKEKLKKFVGKEYKLKYYNDYGEYTKVI